MRFRGGVYTSRFLLVIGLTIVSSGLVLVVPAMAEKDGDEAASGHRHSDAKRHPAEQARRPAKEEAHKTGEPPGKAAGKTTEGKSRGAPPVAVLPPTTPPPSEAQATEPNEPPPKVPRFAALKTDETNMRKGPGQRYPIDWVYQRRDLPLEVEREYDVWRYVRDPDGVQGWVHQVTLSDRRTFMVRDKDATLRAAANETADPVAQLKAGVLGRLRECDQGSQWCEVQVAGYRGYLRRDQIWGLLPDEVLAPS
jgi:SH3-like domain-containing protein